MATSESLVTRIADFFFEIFNISDETKSLKVDLSGATTGKTVTVSSSHTQNRSLGLPDKNGVLETINAERTALSALQIDFAVDEIKTKTLTANSALTIINPVQGKIAVLEVEPAGFALTFPPSVKIISGKFRSNKTNYIYFHCIDGAAPKFVTTISQEL